MASINVHVHVHVPWIQFLELKKWKMKNETQG